jgi:hypothetical protein
MASYEWPPQGGGGSVTSIGLTASPIFTVSGSPVTGAGVIDLELASQPGNEFLASPDGSAGVPSFRAIVAGDIPFLGATYLPIAGGTMTGELVLNPSVQVNPNDAATIGQVASFVSGLAWKSPAAEAAATGNVVVASPVSAVFDGYTASPGDTILLFNQINNTENGIYIFNGTGTPMTRRSDANTSTSLTAATISILNGSTYSGESYTQITNMPTIGTSPIVFTEIGILYAASGLGITLSGRVFSLLTDGVTIDTNGSGNSLRVIPHSIGVTQLTAVGPGAGTYTNISSITINAAGQITNTTSLSGPPILTIDTPSGSVNPSSGIVDFLTGTSGSNFAIVGTGNVVTFNLPDAGVSQRGALTSIAQTFGGLKSFNAGLTILNGTILTLNNSANTFHSSFVTGPSQAVNIAYTLPLTGPNNNFLFGAPGGGLSWTSQVVETIQIGPLQTAYTNVFTWTPTGPQSGLVDFIPAFKTQNANLVFAGPATGAAAAPTFRSLVAADFPAGVGTVTSVGVTGDGVIFNSVFTGSPITTAGTFNFATNLIAQNAHSFFCGPASGSTANPTFRAIQVTDLPHLNNGQLYIGSTAGTGAVAASLSGTTNEIIVTPGAGTITLSLPQAIATTSAVTFGTITDSGLTANGALFAGTAGLITSTPALTNGQLLIGSTGANPQASTLTAGSGISITNAAHSITIASTGVTSVGLSLPSFITVTGSPVTATGVLTGTLATQAANTGFFGPASGAAAAPTFRALVGTDLPSHLIGTGGTPSVVIGTGAGTGGSAALLRAHDSSGIITVNTGTAPQPNATIATVTFASAYGAAPNVALTPFNANAANLGATAGKQVYPTTLATTLVLNSNATALSVATTYQWYYVVVG